MKIVLLDEAQERFAIVFIALLLSCQPASPLLRNSPSTADPSARVSRGDELLFAPNRLQLRLDGSGEIRILFRASVDGSNGATGERHDYEPFMVSTYAACRPLGSSIGARLSFSRNGFSRRFNVSCVGL